LKPCSIFAGAALVAILAASHARAASPTPTPPAATAGRYNDVSQDDYHNHLAALTAIVESCAKTRDTKTCDPALVSLDDRVPLTQAPNAERRLIRYGWLRILLSNAQDKDKVEDTSKAKPVTGANPDQALAGVLPPPKTTTQQLQDALVRLRHDIAEDGSAAAAPPAHTAEREAMKQVLAGREFSKLEAPSPLDRLEEKVGTWLNQLLETATRFGARSPWIGQALIWGFVLAVCTGLVWGIIQLEKRWRVRLTPDFAIPAPTAASAREWQLWLEDARKAAAAGLWREAIHFVYWAAISRLESRRLWPADRARTPREYLALVAATDHRRPGLATLTGSFERTWYGGRPAGEDDYRRAEQLANALISGSSPAASGGGASQ
jgi:hypothetical protein